MINLMIQYLRKTFRLSSICFVCQKYHKGIYPVCLNCYIRLKEIAFPCSSCAHPLPDNKFTHCVDCQRVLPNFDKVITIYQYEQPLRDLLHQFKYYKNLYLGDFLVKLMLDAIERHELQTECLIPVPLHPKKMRERGFNQAAELSKLLSKRLKIPSSLNLCKKTLHTRPQVGLSITERRRNLSMAFQINPLKYQRITLVDDILTTGSTTDELAMLLKKQGAAYVSVLCCARAC